MYNVKPIGIIRNNIENRSKMFSPGVKSSIEIFSEYVPALDSIERNSHIIVQCYMHLAKRDTLRVHPKKFNICLLKEAGVFATRSPDRPNPVSFNVVKLLARNDNILEIEKIDCIDNTPVIDIKPYIRNMDAIFNAEKINLSEKYNISDKDKLFVYLKGCLKNYSFLLDGSEDIAISNIIAFIENQNKMPDRSVIDFLETDYAGGALDTLYYFTMFTPGENKIRQTNGNTSNSILKFYLKNGEVICMEPGCST